MEKITDFISLIFKLIKRARFCLYIFSALSIIYLVLYINQDKYSDLLDNLSMRIFGHADALFLLDDIFFNLLFFAFSAFIALLLLQAASYIFYKNIDQLYGYQTPLLQIRYFLSSFIRAFINLYYSTHILLYYKLDLWDFLGVTYSTQIQSFHSDVLFLPLIISIIFFCFLWLLSYFIR